MKRKKLLQKVTVFVAGFSMLGLLSAGYLVLTRSTVYAAGPQCYTLIQSTYYRKTTCPDNASVDKNNDSSKSFICYFQSDTALHQGKSNFSQKNCLEIAQKNIACVESQCYPGATANGSGGSTEAPNFDFQTSKPQPCNGKEKGLAYCLQNNTIVTNILQPAINFLAVGVGVVVVTMIIVGGLQYGSAGGNPQGVQEGKKKIYNAIFALVVFFFLYAALQWLIPGGIF